MATLRELPAFIFRNCVHSKQIVISTSWYMTEVRYSCRLETFNLKLWRRMKCINKGYKYTLWTISWHMQLTGKSGRPGAGKLGDPVRLNGWGWAVEAAESVAMRGVCLYWGVSLLLCVESNVPILFIRSVPTLFNRRSVPRLFIVFCKKKHLKVEWLHTRRRVLQSFKSDGQREPCGKIGEEMWWDRVARF